MESEEQKAIREAAEQAERTAEANQKAEGQAAELKAKLIEAFKQFIGQSVNEDIIERMRQTAINIAGRGSNIEVQGPSVVVVLASNGDRIEVISES